MLKINRLSLAMAIRDKGILLMKQKEYGIETLKQLFSKGKRNNHL